MNFNPKAKEGKVYDRWMVLILLCSLLVMLFTLHDYGAGFDEPLLYQYANFLPSTYIKAAYGLPQPGFSDFGDLKYYGTSYILVGNLAVKLLNVIGGLDLYDRWHIVNFITFLSGSAVLFWLCKKFSSPLAAFAATLLYLTQPLLWGHAIMNPKDIPFATFFLFSVAAGVKMVDEIKRNPGHHPFTGKRVKAFFRHWYACLAAVLSGLLILDRAANHLFTLPLARSLINSLITLPASSPVKQFILSKAQHFGSLPAEQYVSKLMLQVSLVESILIAALILVAFGILVHRLNLAQRWILIAGVTLGFTTGIRTLGPAAGVLVLIYWIAQTKFKKLIPQAVFYFLVATIATYLLWPYLWQAPLSRFIESFSIMTHFPWPGSVLFEGVEYTAGALPWYYLPKLIGIQFTIPVLLLLFVATVTSIRELFKHGFAGNNTLILLIWFYFPLFTWMILRPNTYDNFRQFLFIIPPIFILISIALDALVNRTHSVYFRTGVLICLILPGIIAGVIQHPYEYIYYNSMVGWSQNIGRNYEADYWSTSFCEAGRFLNPMVTDASRVAFTNDVLAELFQRCITQKPQILVERAEISTISPDYSVISTRWGDDIDYFRWMPVIKTIKIGSTDLLVIKQAK